MDVLLNEITQNGKHNREKYKGRKRLIEDEHFGFVQRGKRNINA